MLIRPTFPSAAVAVIRTGFPKEYPPISSTLSPFNWPARSPATSTSSVPSSIISRIREMIEEGTLLVDVAGERVGQLNGLSVLEIGGYSFGKPVRITATAALGKVGLINIERESNLSGRFHDKGVHIIAGYLRSRFAQDKPLSLAASICFEQSYSGV